MQLYRITSKSEGVSTTLFQHSEWSVVGAKFMQFYVVQTNENIEKIDVGWLEEWAAGGCEINGSRYRFEEFSAEQADYVTIIIDYDDEYEGTWADFYRMFYQHPDKIVKAYIGNADVTPQRHPK